MRIGIEFAFGRPEMNNEQIMPLKYRLAAELKMSAVEFWAEQEIVTLTVKQLPIKQILRISYPSL